MAFDLLDDAEIVWPTILMISSFVFVVVPFVPAPLVLWVVALAFAVFEGFDRVTVLAMVVMTILMVAGTTVDFWLRPLGMRSSGGCLTAIGSLVGGILGTFLIPIPVLGSIIGAVLGAVLVEYMQRRELQDALDAGRSTFKMILIGKVVEFVFCVAILGVYLGSVLTTD